MRNEKEWQEWAKQMLAIHNEYTAEIEEAVKSLVDRMTPEERFETLKQYGITEFRFNRYEYPDIEAVLRDACYKALLNAIRKDML